MSLEEGPFGGLLRGCREGAGRPLPCRTWPLPVRPPAAEAPAPTVRPGPRRRDDRARASDRRLGARRVTPSGRTARPSLGRPERVAGARPVRRGPRQPRAGSAGGAAEGRRPLRTAGGGVPATGAGDVRTARPASAVVPGRSERTASPERLPPTREGRRTAGQAGAAWPGGARARSPGSPAPTPSPRRDRLLLPPPPAGDATGSPSSGSRDRRGPAPLRPHSDVRAPAAALPRASASTSRSPARSRRPCLRGAPAGSWTAWLRPPPPWRRNDRGTPFAPCGRC